MKVYQIISEDETPTYIYECVSAPDFKTVAEMAIRRAEELDYDLISIKYICTVVEHLKAD